MEMRTVNPSYCFVVVFLFLLGGWGGGGIQGDDFSCVFVHFIGD